MGVTGLALTVIAGIAALRAAQGDLEGTVVSGASVEAHPVTWRETRSQVASLLATLAAELPEETANAALARGRAVDLPALVNTLLGS